MQEEIQGKKVISGGFLLLGFQRQVGVVKSRAGGR